VRRREVPARGVDEDAATECAHHAEEPEHRDGGQQGQHHRGVACAHESAQPEQQGEADGRHQGGNRHLVLQQEVEGFGQVFANGRAVGTNVCDAARVPLRGRPTAHGKRTTKLCDCVARVSRSSSCVGLAGTTVVLGAAQQAGLERELGRRILHVAPGAHGLALEAEFKTDVDEVLPDLVRGKAVLDGTVQHRITELWCLLLRRTQLFEAHVWFPSGPP